MAHAKTFAKPPIVGHSQMNNQREAVSSAAIRKSKGRGLTTQWRRGFARALPISATVLICCHLFASPIFVFKRSSEKSPLRFVGRIDDELRTGSVRLCAPSSVASVSIDHLRLLNARRVPTARHIRRICNAASVAHRNVRRLLVPFASRFTRRCSQPKKRSVNDLAPSPWAPRAHLPALAIGAGVKRSRGQL